MLGYKRVKDDSKFDKYTRIENWEHVLNDGLLSTKRRNELFEMTEITRIAREMTTKQILLYVSKMWKPHALSIKS